MTAADLLPRVSDAPGLVKVNGVASHLLIEATAAHPSVNGVTYKREVAGPAAMPYGHGQPLQVLSPSAQDVSDMAGDYGPTPGRNPVLARIDPYGGAGFVNGVHIAPGLRDNYGGPTAIGLWVQLGQGGVDTPGVIITTPPPAAGYKSAALVVKVGTVRAFTVDAAGMAWLKADPVAPLGAATKAYVDAQIAQLRGELSR